MTMSHDAAGGSHSPEHAPKRPKGILKNSTSFIHQQPTASSPEKGAVSPPPVPVDTVENKEITLQNTLQNAGRRSSSTRRTSLGRRLSGPPSELSDQADNRAPHLKWDEANLYLTEQEKTSKMKIDEPKTPWAPSYDPSQDEREQMELEAQDHTIQANDLVVDELDQARHKKVAGAVHDHEIPDLELGEPEEDVHAHQHSGSNDRITRERSLSQNSNRSDKHVDVVVDNDDNAVNGHGEHLLTSEEAKEKHRRFEEHRKKHYEMRNIKDILAHPEELDEMDDDEDGDASEPPKMPKIPKDLA